MALVYTIVIPILIVIINYLVTKNKPRKASGYIDILLKSLPHEYGYMFFLYWLEEEQKVNTGWAPITLINVLFPITVVLLLLKMLNWIFSRE